MREGIAVSKPPAEEDDSSNVVPFPVRSVDYAGSAAALMTRLAIHVTELRKTLDKRDRHNIRPRVLAVIDKIIETMDMIEHHMDVIDDCSDVLREFIEPGGRAYFSSKGSEIPLEIISQIERRQATLMVRRFIFRAADGPMPMFEHNDDRQILLTHDGCIACQWPRAS